MSELIQVVYVGRDSGLYISDLGIEVVHGVPFSVKKEWFDARVAVEPWWELYVPIKQPKKVDG